MTERIPVVVVGAGPAGLATSQQLKERGVPHRVLERGEAVGYTWANLYNSLTLHTGKHMSSLPGLAFPARRRCSFPGVTFGTTCGTTPGGANAPRGDCSFLKVSSGPLHVGDHTRGANSLSLALCEPSFPEPLCHVELRSWFSFAS